MKYNGIIQRKLALLDDQVIQLEKHLQQISLEAFRQSWLLRSMSERALQVAVEIIIDIAERIIALHGAGPVESAGAAMDKLVVLGVLSDVGPYRDMVRFRNLIVHEYERIDPDLLYMLATQRLGDFRRFRADLDQANAVSS